MTNLCCQINNSKLIKKNLKKKTNFRIHSILFLIHIFFMPNTIDEGFVSKIRYYVKLKND